MTPTSRLELIHDRLRLLMTVPDGLYLYVDAESQELAVCRNAAVIERFRASTARLGMGNREGSNRTPAGVHRIAEKIGAGAPEGRIFRDRIDTGVEWREGLTEGNLILTRILRLAGCEQGLNRGPGVDSFDRYIYIHATNREAHVGTPLSHGCVCLRSSDIVRLFDMVSEGTPVYIDPPRIAVNGIACSHIHFTGIFGSGMSGLAQFLQWRGVTVTGSDRLLDSKDTANVREKLVSAGCTLFGQDGSGVTLSTDAVCVSTAVEASNPDIAAAAARGVPVLHRSDVLAAVVASKTSIAVAGTSGKSTVTAMIFEFLTACGKSPSLVSGAPLLRLERQGYFGNAFSGTSDLLVVEADESDGTIVKYRPAIGVILNVSKDHKSVDEIAALFAAFARQCGWVALNAVDRVLDKIDGDARFGPDAGATWRPDRIDVLPDSTAVEYRGVTFRLKLPGRHNAENLCAALCVCERLGCGLAELAAASETFQGVARRFSMTHTRQGVTVVDDFAHNPAKIAAAVAAARGISKRIIAVYQPHGFGPTRFLKDEYAATFRSVFREPDALFLLPIYYAGGTAEKSISSEDIVRSLGRTSFRARAVADRESLLAALTQETRSGDCVLLMGARDPSLPGLAKKIAELFGGPAQPQ